MALYPAEIPDIEALIKRVITEVDWTFLMDELQALFDILGINPQGTKATVADRLGSEGSITEFDIADGAITTPKLHDGAVTEIKIFDGAVTTPKLGPGAVTGAKIAPGTITGDKIAGNQITGAHIVDGSLTAADLAPGTLTKDALAPGASLWTVNQQVRFDIIGTVGANPLPYLSTSVTTRPAGGLLRIFACMHGSAILPAAYLLRWQMIVRVNGSVLAAVEQQGQGQTISVDVSNALTSLSIQPQVPFTWVWEQEYLASTGGTYTVAVESFFPDLGSFSTLNGGCLVVEIPA